MSRKPHTTRAFTRTDVVQFFTTHFGAFRDPTYALLRVQLLPQVPSGAWLVEYTTTFVQGMVDHVYYRELVLLQVARADGTPYLSLADWQTLPEGCATPQEEDAALEAAFQAWRAQQEEEQARAKSRD